MRWFTSDTHFGHANAIKFGRPFSTMEEMDAELARRWNALVGDDDEVWHLGDFCWPKKPGAYLDQLKGRLHLIVGNHDHKQTRNHPRWLSVQHFIELKDGPENLTLCHYALEVWNKSHYGALHFHGHSHGNLPSRGRRIDVGVDAHSFAPLEEGNARALARALPLRTPDHHKTREPAPSSEEK